MCKPFWADLRRDAVPLSRGLKARGKAQLRGAEQTRFSTEDRALGRDQSAEELAGRLAMPLDQVRKLMTIAGLPVRLETPAGAPSLVLLTGR